MVLLDEMNVGVDYGLIKQGELPNLAGSKRPSVSLFLRCLLRPQVCWEFEMSPGLCLDIWSISWLYYK
jgi:hypothetical protein